MEWDSSKIFNITSTWSLFSTVLNTDFRWKETTSTFSELLVYHYVQVRLNIVRSSERCKVYPLMCEMVIHFLAVVNKHKVSVVFECNQVSKSTYLHMVRWTVVMGHDSSQIDETGTATALLIFDVDKMSQRVSLTRCNSNLHFQTPNIRKAVTIKEELFKFNKQQALLGWQAVFPLTLTRNLSILGWHAAGQF